MQPAIEPAVDMPRPIRLLEPERDALLDRLDEADGRIEVDGVVLIKGNRAIWRQPSVVLMVEHPGGGMARFEVCTRWISPDRIGLVHRGFLHPRTPCSIRLPNIWNGFDEVPGAVASCEHAQGLIHRLDIVPRARVDLWRFLEKGPVLTKLSCRDVASAPLEGRVLHLESEAAVRETVSYLLRDTKLRLVGAPTVGAALDEGKRVAPHAILMDVEVDGQPADTVIQTLRDAGIASPVLLVTGETHPAKVGRAKAAGVTTVVELPCDAEVLVEAIRPWVPQSIIAQADLVTSSLSSHPEAQPMLNAYLDRLTRWREELQCRTQESDLEVVRRACMGIKATAQTVGFDVLSEAAKRAIVALDASSSVTESAPVILALVSVLARVRSNVV